MIGNIEKPEFLSILQSPSSDHGVVSGRPSHAFVFKISGESVYTFADAVIHLSRGEMLFIPQGSIYTVRRVSPGDSRYVLINFRGELTAPRPEIFRLEDHSSLCARLCRISLLDTLADRYRAQAVFYEVLAAVCERAKSEYLCGSTAAGLDPALEYLRRKLYDPELKVGQLHTLCGISDTYFRMLFQARFGVSPKKYILQNRLRHAKALLDHGEYGSVAQVALQSGFDDPLYFSKVFKQTYGYPPSQGSRMNQTSK